jgi:hypothetical protein
MLEGYGRTVRPTIQSHISASDHSTVKNIKPVYNFALEDEPRAHNPQICVEGSLAIQTTKYS